MKYIVDGNNLEELQIVVREPHGKDRIIEFKGDTDNLIPMSDVNLYDWDGTLLFAYTKENFLKMTDFPTVAAQEGMTFEGWNWSFEGAQNYVHKYGKVNVGRMCYPILPEDKKDALLMEMHIPEGGFTNVPLLFSQSVSHGVKIDWGDGSEVETVEGEGLVTTTHQYPSDNAVYTIAIKALDGCEIQYGDGENQKNIFGDSSTLNYGYCDYLQYLTIPKGVTSIDQYAFNNCFALKSLIISEGVISIGKYAFVNCIALKSLTIPEGVTSIGQSVFNGCYALRSITIPEGVTNIGEAAFNYCYSLQSLIIPEGVTSIGQYAFGNCYALWSLAIPESVISIGQQAFNGCCALQSLTIPEGVTSIGQNAFGNCFALQSLTIPEGVTSIDERAFYNCYALQSLTIPEGVTSIGKQAFVSCYALQSLTISEGMTSMGQSAFGACFKLTSLSIQEGVASIGQTAFAFGRALHIITLPASITSIGASAFSKCFALETVVMLGTTPPTLNSGAFELEGDKTFRIYVPYSEDHSILNAYKAATNWAAYADYMVESEPIETSETEPTEEEPVNE